MKEDGGRGKDGGADAQPSMFGPPQRTTDNGQRATDNGQWTIDNGPAPSSFPPITLKGPMPCAISKIAGYYRNQIVLQCARADALQKVLGLLREAGHLATSERIAVDVDPVSLL